MSFAGILGVGVGLIAVGSLQSAIRPLFNKINQEAFRVWPNELLPPSNLIEMRYRGIIDQGRYSKELQEQGLDNERGELLYRQSERLLNAYDYITLFRREVISESERNDRLKRLGLSDDSINFLLQTTREVPSVHDIITFAVREVYSPQIAQKFGQYEGADDVYSEAEPDILAANMTKETFRKYWAAHWSLPSMMQGYEMLHRQVIKDDELDMLMVAADVMPWWRDKLKAISYNPFTRVDVRRMHKMGLLSEADVTRAYKDLGYDDDKADKMTQFTVEYNASPEAAEQTPEDVAKETYKEATKANVMAAFRNNLINEEEAIMYLADIGYSDDAIALFMATEIYDRQNAELNEQIDMIHDGFVHRVYDAAKTTAKLGELNLPAAYTENLLNKWVMEMEGKTNRPSKAELFSMHKLGIITDDILRRELAGHGYPATYIDWYMALIRKKGSVA